MTASKPEPGTFWAEVAPTWLELEDTLDLLSTAPGEVAMRRLRLGGGERVVDLGCGAGRTTLALASQVGARGHVIGIDIAEDLVVRARVRAREKRVTNVDFVHGDIQVHDLGRARFDAAYSRFGVMFFADPTAAFGNIRASLKDDGVLSFVCWQTLFDNEWILVPGAALMSQLSEAPAPPDLGGPGPFSLSDPGHVQAVLSAAGFRDVEIVGHRDELLLGADDLSNFARMTAHIGPGREMLRHASDAVAQEAIASIENALRNRMQAGHTKLTRAFHSVVARA